jgi:ER lumen protein retaining receptor
MKLVLWLFEIGYLLQHLATVLQILRILNKKSTELVSIDTNIIFLVTSIAKMFWIFDTMLRKMWISYVECVVALVSLSAIIYYYYLYKKNDFSTIEEMPKYLRWYVLLSVVMILSFFSHPGSKGKYYFTLQMLVSVSIYGEAIGLLPQIYVLRTTKDTGNVSHYFCICLGFARIFRLLFWVQMYISNTSFIWLMIADMLHTALFGYFVFTFVKNLNTFSLPTFGNAQVQTKKVF